LRVRSHGSLLHGTAAPEALVTRALELDYPALALTDRDNLYVAIRFYRTALAHGLVPLLGAEITPARPGGPAALLIALDRRGYAAGRARLPERVAAARRLGLPLVATGEVATLAPRDHDLHRVAVTAGRGELLERMPPDAFAAREAWLASPVEWVRRVRAVCAGAGLPDVAEESLAHNAALAARCRLAIELG